jgi:pimeloyl-ACP methyl ester carboxylesterase
MDLYGGMQRYIRRSLERRGATASELIVRGERVFHYDVRGEGKGPPIVLVHGLGGSANGFSRVLLGLAKRYSRVLAPDLPGNGFSAARAPLSLRDQLDVLEGFIEQTVGGPAVVVGNSLGGALSLSLAIERPQRVRALVLIAPAGARVAHETQAALLASLQPTSTAHARQLMRRLFHRAPLLALLFAGELKKVYGSPAVQTIVREAPTLEGLTPEELRSIRAPTLLLWGGSEKLLPIEMLAYFRQHLPEHVHIEVVHGFGHVPQVEHPRQVIERLHQFADQHGL